MISETSNRAYLRADSSSSFCDTGALPGDSITLNGCKDDTTCAPGFSCVHTPRLPETIDSRTIRGLCLDKNNVVALRDASVDIDKGEFVFLVGASGSGKSTFLRLLNREEVPNQGEIFVAGKDIGQLTLHFGADDVNGTLEDERIQHLSGAQTPAGLAREQDRDIALRRVGQPAGRLLDRRHELLRHRSADRLVDELEAGTALERLELVFPLQVARIFAQHLGHADDRIQRRAQFV